MSFKNILSIILLSFLTLPCYAMRVEKHECEVHSKSIKVIGYVTLNSEISSVIVPTLVKIAVPDLSWTKEQRMNYYVSQKNIYDAKVADILKGYVTMQCVRHDNRQLTLPPATMIIHPDTDMIEVRDDLGEFIVQGIGTVGVEIRAAGKYYKSPKVKINNTTYPEAYRIDGALPLVNITRNGKTEVITLAQLKNAFPFELQDTLHIRPETESKILADYDDHCFASKVVGAKATPFNPHTLVKNMYKLDMQKMVAYYLQTKDILDVD